MSAVDQREITEAQRRIDYRPATLRSRTDYRRAARWWELEARRGYPSSPDALRYARNMRWAAELTETYGEGTWLDLHERLASAARVAKAESRERGVRP